MTLKVHFSKFSLAIIDILLFHGSILLSFWLRPYFTHMEYFNISNIQSYLELFPWISIIVFIVFSGMELYDTGNRQRFSKYVYNIPIAVLAVNLFTMALAFWNRSFAFPRSVLVSSLLLEVCFILAFRFVIWLLVKRFHGIKRVVIVSNDQVLTRRLTDKLMVQSNSWFQLNGQLTSDEYENIELSELDADIVLIGSDISKTKAATLLNDTIQSGKEVMMVPDSYHLFMKLAEVQQIDDTLVLSIRPPHLTTKQKQIKRAFDLISSLMMILISFPILILLYFIVKATSPGPALYVQERVGLNGKTFNIYKFRTMVNNAEDNTGPVLASEEDPRITRVGKFMRSTRLDELPQLFNVLKGDMSLVGPRPERRVFVDKFQEEVPDSKYRINVKPGITGLAQVLSNYNTTIEDKVQYDLIYVNNYSIVLDIKILFQTIRVVIQRDSVKGIRPESNNGSLFNLFGISELNQLKVETRSDSIDRPTGASSGSQLL